MGNWRPRATERVTTAHVRQSKRQKRGFRVRLGRYTLRKELTSNDDTLCLKRRIRCRMRQNTVQVVLFCSFPTSLGVINDGGSTHT